MFEDKKIAEAISSWISNLERECPYSEKKIPFNAFESDNSYLYEFILAGINKEYLKIFSEDGKIKVEYKNENKNEKAKFSFLRGSSLLPIEPVSEFKFSISLNGKEDIDKISVEYVNGILKINIPKKEEFTKVKNFTVK